MVSNIPDRNTCFFPHFTADSVFECFAGFDETGKGRVELYWESTLCGSKRKERKGVNEKEESISMRLEWKNTETERAHVHYDPKESFDPSDR